MYFTNPRLLLCWVTSWICWHLSITIPTSPASNLSAGFCLIPSVFFPCCTPAQITSVISITLGWKDRLKRAPRGSVVYQTNNPKISDRLFMVVLRLKWEKSIGRYLWTTVSCLCERLLVRALNAMATITCFFVSEPKWFKG